MQRLLLALALFVLPTACATPAATFHSPKQLQDVGSISGSRVYVYSFLGITRDLVGNRTLQALDRQLVERLGQASITIAFGHTSMAPVNDRLVVEHHTYGGREGFTSLPVEQAIAAERSGEERFGAAYRLVIVPYSLSSLDGYAGAYSARWTLIDVRTGEPVWQIDMDGGSSSGNVEERAAAIVDGVIEQMRLSGLL